MVRQATTVYAVILNYRNYSDTLECIKNLLTSTYPSLKIIVIDNKSPNDAVARIAEGLSDILLAEGGFSFFNEGAADINFNSTVSIIEAKENYGFALGNNIALKQLTAVDSYVFMVNPDIIVTPDTINALVDLMSVKDKKTIIGCKIHNYQSKAFEYTGGVRIKPLTGTVKLVTDFNDEDIDYVCGGALFFHSDAINEVGMLPSDYFLYWEDADWCSTALQKGYRLLTSKDALVYGKGATSIGRGYVAEYYYTRNALIFHKKQKKQVVSIILSNLFFRLPKKIVLGQISRAKAVIDGTFDFIRKKHFDAHQKKISIS